MTHRYVVPLYEPFGVFLMQISGCDIEQAQPTHLQIPQCQFLDIKTIASVCLEAGTRGHGGHHSIDYDCIQAYVKSYIMDDHYGDHVELAMAELSESIVNTLQYYTLLGGHNMHYVFVDLIDYDMVLDIYEQ